MLARTRGHLWGVMWAAARLGVDGSMIELLCPRNRRCCLSYVNISGVSRPMARGYSCM